MWAPAPTSPWNTRIDGADIELDPDSDHYRDYLVNAIKAHGIGYGGGDPVPFYRVPDDTPLVPVHVNAAWAPGLVARFAQGVPIPADANAFPNRDANLVIRRGNQVWEMFGFVRGPDGTCTCKYAGWIPDVTTDPGYYYNGFDPDGTQLTWWNWGVSASGLPCYAGMVRVWEAKHRIIDHALAMFVPHARLGLHCPPAQRQDGSTNEPYAPIEGSRWRLDPARDLTALQLPDDVFAYGRALQKYGALDTDQSLFGAFFREELGANIYLTPGGLALLPWEDLQLVKMTVMTKDQHDPTPRTITLPPA